jgi:putative PIN family toxin of toxin-antitoxin system
VGHPHEILRLAEGGRLTLVFSPAIVEEVVEALARPKFAARLTVLRTSGQELLESLISLAEVSVPRRVVPVVTADPEDDKILACARAAQARWLVTGDGHLLAVGDYHGIRIVDPRTFLTLWQAGQETSGSATGAGPSKKSIRTQKK